MKNRIIIIVVFVLVTLSAGYGIYLSNQTPKPVHFHAGFKVFVDGIAQDYSDSKFMAIKPCAVSGAETKKSAAEIQNEKAHLHDNEGTVMHAHVDGGRWADLFRNMHVTLPEGREITGYVNGKKVPNIMGERIRAYDSVVIIVGSGVDMQKALGGAVTKEHISAIEKKSESCSS